jgi:hypothetical protein
VNNGQQDKAPYVADTPAMVALRTQGFAVLDGCLSDASATKLHGALMQGVRDMLAGIPRPGQTPEARQRILASTDEEMVRDCYTDPEWKTSRYFKRNKLDLYTVKPKANTQGAHGLTNTSGMFDVVSDPAFADAQVDMHDGGRDGHGGRDHQEVRRCTGCKRDEEGARDNVIYRAVKHINAHPGR